MKVSEQMWPHKCEACGKEWETNDWNKPRPEFCGKDCEDKYNKKQREEQIKHRIKNIIPIKYQDIETDKQDLLLKSATKSLFITGDVGTGKTVFMASLAKEYIKQRKHVVWISYSRFIMALQNAYKNDVFYDSGYGGRSKRNPFDMAETKAMFQGYLFIDDLGAEKLTEYVRQITYYILNEREQNSLPTIITSNFSLDEINNSIDRRISSRICGMCEVLKFAGADKRLKKS